MLDKIEKTHCFIQNPRPPRLMAKPMAGRQKLHPVSPAFGRATRGWHSTGQGIQYLLIILYKIL
jgi:hypothetical protein